ncbi:hypothetical protein [Robbsia andropogonis]|uniref:hypothetical protein n=1 Tax=Robbsia andropogonis TaxID=28092 RepID=UPI0039B76629
MPIADTFSIAARIEAGSFIAVESRKSLPSRICIAKAASRSKLIELSMVTRSNCSRTPYTMLLTATIFDLFAIVISKMRRMHGIKDCKGQQHYHRARHKRAPVDAAARGSALYFVVGGHSSASSSCSSSSGTSPR